MIRRRVASLTSETDDGGAMSISIPHDSKPDSNATEPTANPRGTWPGRVLSGIAVAFLTLDAAMKIAAAAPAVTGTIALGFPVEVVRPLGVVLLVATVLYVVPRTAALGALLLTGYLGGAVAAHVRLGDPLATHVLTPVYVAAFLWAGLALRDRKVRALFL